MQLVQVKCEGVISQPMRGWGRKPLANDSSSRPAARPTAPLRLPRTKPTQFGLVISLYSLFTHVKRRRAESDPALGRVPAFRPQGAGSDVARTGKPSMFQC